MCHTATPLFLHRRGKSQQFSSARRRGQCGWQESRERSRKCRYGHPHRKTSKKDIGVHGTPRRAKESKSGRCRRGAACQIRAFHFRFWGVRHGSLLRATQSSESSICQALFIFIIFLFICQASCLLSIPSPASSSNFLSVLPVSTVMRESEEIRISGIDECVPNPYSSSSRWVVFSVLRAFSWFTYQGCRARAFRTVTNPEVSLSGSMLKLVVVSNSPAPRARAAVGNPLSFKQHLS